MAKTIDDSSYNIVALDDQLLTAREAQRTFGLWLLLAIGILIVCFSSGLSVMLVPKDQTGVYSTEQANQILTSLRITGVMVFVVGLVDRVIIKLREKDN